MKDEVCSVLISMNLLVVDLMCLVRRTESTPRLLLLVFGSNKANFCEVFRHDFKNEVAIL